MNGKLLLLLLGSFMLLLVLCLITLISLRLQASRRQLAERVAVVTGVHLPTRVIESGPVGGGRIGLDTAPLVRKAAGLFGFNPDRTGHYPLKWWLVLPTALLVAWLLEGLLASLVGALAWAMVPLAWVLLSRAFFKYFDSRRTRELYVQFPDALAMIVRAVRVGIPVTESIRTVAREAIAPTTEEFGILTDQITIGVPLEEGLRELAERNSLPEYRFFATALSLQAQTGGGLSETLENLADVIRKRVALRARAYALASEARTSILILSALPVVAGGALSVLNPSYINLLFYDESGQKVLASALISLATGVAVMKLIVKKSLS